MSEVMNLSAAAATIECRLALVKSPEAARAALAKHRASITPELAQALEIVGSYTTLKRGRTPLHQAVANADAVTVEALLAAGAKPANIKDSNGMTPLKLAIDDACREILEHHAAVHSSITDDSTTLVASAFALCATLSASKKPLPPTALSLRSHQLDPLLLWAPPAARAAVVAWARNAFIVHFAPTTQPFEALSVDCAGDVLEFFGMTHNESECIATQCSSLEAQAWVGAVLAPVVLAKATIKLVSAAKKNDLATVQDCRLKSVNIDAKVDGITALIYASDRGHIAIVEALVEAGADKDVKNSKNGYTALISASGKGHTATVKVLVEAGADKDIKDKDGYTALMSASNNGHIGSVQILVNEEANKDTKNKNGQTALMMASTKGHTTTVQILVRAGADTKAKGKNGYTALMCAAAGGHTETVRLLLKAGADKEAKNKGGFTALKMASGKGHTATVKALAEYK